MTDVLAGLLDGKGVLNFSNLEEEERHSLSGKWGCDVVEGSEISWCLR